MSEKKFKIHYRGSLGWLIFWLIVFFPIGIVLLFTDTTFDMGEKSYDFHYGGSKFWLGFWILVFFPIAILLMFLNGFTIQTKNRE